MKALKNWRTSIMGFLAVLCKSGAATAPAWAGLLTPLGDFFMAAGLIAAKDAATGSAP